MAKYIALGMKYSERMIISKREGEAREYKSAQFSLQWELDLSSQRFQLKLVQIVNVN